jgi:hypothetical protein
VILKSEQQTQFAVFIPASQLSDGRVIRSFRAYPTVIGLCIPFTFPFGSMSDSLCLMRLHRRVSGHVTAGLVHGPPKEIDPLVNMDQNIPCILRLSIPLGLVWEEFSIGPISWHPGKGKSEEKSGQVDSTYFGKSPCTIAN